MNLVKGWLRWLRQCYMLFPRISACFTFLFHFFQFSFAILWSSQHNLQHCCRNRHIVVCWSKGYHKRTWPGWSFKDGQYPPNFFLYLHDVWFDFPFLTFFLWYDMILIQNDRCDTLQHFCLLPDMQSNSKNVTAFWCFLVEPGDLHWRTLAPFISYDHPSSNWWIGRGVAVSGRCDVVIGTATLICNDLE